MSEKKNKGNLELAVSGVLGTVAAGEAAVGGLLAYGTGASIASAAAASVCPLCVAGAAAFLGVGLVKKMKK